MGAGHGGVGVGVAAEADELEQRGERPEGLGPVPGQEGEVEAQFAPAHLR